MTETTTPSPGYRDVSMPLTEIATNGLWLSLLLVAVPLVPYWLVYGFGPFWGAVLGRSGGQCPGRAGSGFWSGCCC